MTSTSHYSQLALLVYDVNKNNKIKLPDDSWSGAPVPDDSSGFSYGVFEKGNEIVISYTGTNAGFSEILTGNGDWATNAAAGIGWGAEQLNKAALIAAQIINEYKNSGKTITFTGHSLGGGPASVIATKGVRDILLSELSH